MTTSKPPLKVRALQALWDGDCYREKGVVFFDPRGEAFEGITEAVVDVNPSAPAALPTAKAEVSAPAVRRSARRSAADPITDDVF